MREIADSSLRPSSARALFAALGLALFLGGGCGTAASGDDPFGGGSPAVGEDPDTSGGAAVAGTLAGIGGAGQAGLIGATGATSGAGGVVATVQPPCLSAPRQGVFIGDSYITGFLSPPLQPALAALYPRAGAFRNHAVAGTSMASGGLGLIPPQLDWTLLEDPRVKLVIMDGGGNDFLICDPIKYPHCDSLCSAPGSSTQKVCREIVAAAVARMGQLATRMASAGVKDVIYFFYPHIPLRNGGFREIIDYAGPLVRQQCQDIRSITGGQVTCHFVDLIDPFAAAGGDVNPANFSFLDGIHPSGAGQAIIARQIWSTMQSGCLGQAAASGCCTP